MVRGANSEWFDVISGVPQGLVLGVFLGPILFLIYANNTPETVNSNVKCLLMTSNYSEH